MTYRTSTPSPPTPAQRDRIEQALIARGVLALQIDRITLRPVDGIPGFTHHATITVYGAPDWECYITREGGVSSMTAITIDEFDGGAS